MTTFHMIQNNIVKVFRYLHDNRILRFRGIAQLLKVETIDIVVFMEDQSEVKFTNLTPLFSRYNINPMFVLGLSDRLLYKELNTSSSRVAYAGQLLILQEKISVPEYFRTLGIGHELLNRIMDGELHISGPRRISRIVFEKWDLNPIYVYDSEWKKACKKVELFMSDATC